MPTCCIECFNDDFLIEHIIDNGQAGDCDYHKKSHPHCIDTDELQEMFMPVANLYTPIEDFMWTEDMRRIADEGSGEFIWDKLNDDWNIFNDSLDYGQIIELTKDILGSSNPKDGDGYRVDSNVVDEEEYIGIDLERNEEHKQEWEDFCHELKHGNRYFPEKTFRILENVIPHCEDGIEKDEFFFRARINDGHSKWPCGQMGKPPMEKTKHGRGNPEGISYLYLATTAQTAMKEVRPNIHDHLTVAKFRFKNDARIINLTSRWVIDSPFKHGDKLKSVLDSLYPIRLLKESLSTPIDLHKASLDYLPTQYLCEFIKKKGYAGLMYISSFSPRDCNLLIYDEGLVSCEGTELYKFSGKIEKIND